MSDRPLMHPVIVAMIEAAGRSVAEYLETTGGATHFKTRTDLGAPDTRLIEMPDLPAHTSGLTHQNEIMTSVTLASAVRFLTGTPESGASILMDDRVLPDTIRMSVVGRHVTEVIDHAMLRVPGLTIVSIEPMAQPYKGQMRLRLSALRWRRT